MKRLSDDFIGEVVEIMHCSKKVNGDDSSKILDMICEHGKEINELYNLKDNHWKIETADLIVLCCELLMMHNEDVDEVLSRCLPRFYRKLQSIEKQGETL